MSHEITSTKRKFNQFPQIPEGRRRYLVIAPVRKIAGKNDSEFFIWTLQYQNELGETCMGEQMLMPSMMGALLRVLDCLETEPEVFDWDTDEMEGRAFIATATHAPDKKDASIIRVHMSDYATGDLNEDTPEIPFGAAVGAVGTEVESDN